MKKKLIKTKTKHISQILKTLSNEGFIFDTVTKNTHLYNDAIFNFIKSQDSNKIFILLDSNNIKEKSELNIMETINLAIEIFYQEYKEFLVKQNKNDSFLLILNYNNIKNYDITKLETLKQFLNEEYLKLSNKYGNTEVFNKLSEKYDIPYDVIKTLFINNKQLVK